MGTIPKNKIVIPLNEVKGTEKIFGRQVQLDVDNVPKKFQDLFEKTKSLTESKLRAEGIWASYKIQERTDTELVLEEGYRLSGAMLLKMFEKSDEVIFFVVTVHGYEELDEGESNLGAKFFLDGWGTAYVECAYSWLKKKVVKELEDRGLHGTSSWSPGQHDVPLSNQVVLFEALKPDEIGVTLNASFMMNPKKSVSGIMGVGSEKDERNLQPCDFCNLRDKCPTAYVEDFLTSE